MQQTDIVPADIRVLSEQIYQYQKGVRQMVLCTFHKRHESLAIKKLNSHPAFGKETTQRPYSGRGFYAWSAIRLRHNHAM